MTPAERKEYVDQVRERLRAEMRAYGAGGREADIRAGRRKPRNRAELAIFGSDIIDRRVDDDEDSDT